jgi:hypothetical protein
MKRRKMSRRIRRSRRSRRSSRSRRIRSRRSRSRRTRMRMKMTMRIMGNHLGQLEWGRWLIHRLMMYIPW